jgi:hypothetical protein
MRTSVSRPCVNVWIIYNINSTCSVFLEVNLHTSSTNPRPEWWWLRSKARSHHRLVPLAVAILGLAWLEAWRSSLQGKVPSNERRYRSEVWFNMNASIEEYTDLREFSKTFEIALMGLSGAWIKLIHENLATFLYYIRGFGDSCLHLMVTQPYRYTWYLKRVMAGLPYNNI